MLNAVEVRLTVENVEATLNAILPCLKLLATSKLEQSMRQMLLLYASELWPTTFRYYKNATIPQQQDTLGLLELYTL